ncbi:MAG: endonuclease NucS [Candidatus Bathyarchaeota archaeon]|nr:endonuclease NucS [Candidatus Bathyarchaeota archaeon]
MSVLTYNSPSLDDSLHIIRNALSKHMLTVLLGNCKVIYDGRASSTLEWGIRLIILKADGSVLVHRPVGYEPVNWQPPGSTLRVEFLENKLKLTAVRGQPKEILSIFFSQIYHILTSNLTDTGEFSLYVSELDMKKAILASPNLIEEGFHPLSAEKDTGEAGFVDVFGEDKNGNLVIIEVKRTQAGKDAVLQLKRYVDALKERFNRPLRGILAAPEVQKDAQFLLATNNLEFKQLSPRMCHDVLKTFKVKKLSEFLT